LQDWGEKKWGGGEEARGERKGGPSENAQTPNQEGGEKKKSIAIMGGLGNYTLRKMLEGGKGQFSTPKEKGGTQTTLFTGRMGKGGEKRKKERFIDTFCLPEFHHEEEVKSNSLIYEGKKKKELELSRRGGKGNPPSLMGGKVRVEKQHSLPVRATWTKKKKKGGQGESIEGGGERKKKGKGGGPPPPTP